MYVILIGFIEPQATNKKYDMPSTFFSLLWIEAKKNCNTPI